MQRMAITAISGEISLQGKIFLQIDELRLTFRVFLEDIVAINVRFCP